MSDRARRKRLARVQKVWEDDFDKCVMALNEARARAEVAQAHLEEARARTRAARSAKADLVRGGSADDWAAREAWLMTCGIREEKAVIARSVADRAVQDAQAAVVVATQKIERLKLVIARLARGDAEDARRAERVIEDEAAARMSRGSS
jgi:flagellar biosynthesis chaperone FliJ